MKNHRRLLAGLLLAVLTLTLFVSSAYIVCEARHECTGEKCEICEQILRAEALIQRFALVAMVSLLLFAALFMENAVHALRESLAASGRTLIGWKVRLNN